MTMRTDHPAAAATRAPEAPGIDEVQLSPAASPDTFPQIAAALRQSMRTEGAAGVGPAPIGHPGQAGIGATGMITNLWSYDSPVGVWVTIDGVGWKRLSPASEPGHRHLAILATCATDANIPVYYNLDANGNIDQLYV